MNRLAPLFCTVNWPAAQDRETGLCAHAKDALDERGCILLRRRRWLEGSNLAQLISVDADKGGKIESCNEFGVAMDGVRQEVLDL